VGPDAADQSSLDRSKVTGSFDSLTEGQRVSYEKAMDPRRNKENAEQVTPI